MAQVLSQPLFQVFTHQDTGQKTGRIYFPALFLAEFHTSVSQWLQQQEIIFEERDLKQYGDASFRFYFKTTDEFERVYFQLITMTKKHLCLSQNNQY